MYPYDNEELDEEERSLNSQIKVRPGKMSPSQTMLTVPISTSFPLQWSVLRILSSSEVNRSAGDKTDGVSSMVCAP